MSKKYMIQVSIVIVCMNNLKNLYPCLNSIQKYTHVTYETIVVAYLFSKENLEKARKDFPWVSFIVSNEIRGFSENNNLALRQAKGKYCFVLNDDTEMEMPVIDRLVESFKRCPANTAIVSPVTTFSDGRVQVCGRPPITWRNYILSQFHLWKENKQKHWVNKTGLFKSYNILGAAFLIKTDVFKDVGWFDETYFFSPEDIVLSTLLNKKGYECWVDNNARVIHHEGMTSKSLSMVQTATKPAGALGSLLFYSDGKLHIRIILTITGISFAFFRAIYHWMRGCRKPNPNIYSIMAIGDWHTLAVHFTRLSPKEVFKKYYFRLNKL